MAVSGRFSRIAQPAIRHESGCFMAEIFGIRIGHELEPDAVERLKMCIAPEKKSRIERYVRHEDRLRGLLGDVLARYCLCERLGAANRELEFTLGPFGKPELARPGGVHFNVSHSGDWVICGVDDEPIGVDVEAYKEIGLDIAERFFTPLEYEDILSKDGPQRQRHFYTLWTLKESYIKAEGKGLSIPLQSFSIRVRSGEAGMAVDRLSSYQFGIYELDSGHVAAACTRGKKAPARIGIIGHPGVLLRRLMPTP